MTGAGDRQGGGVAVGEGGGEGVAGLQEAELSGSGPVEGLGAVELRVVRQGPRAVGIKAAELGEQAAEAHSLGTGRPDRRRAAAQRGGSAAVSTRWSR